MIELFPEVTKTTRALTEIWIKQAKSQNDPFKAALMLKKCRDYMPDEISKEYFDLAVKCNFLTDD